MTNPYTWNDIADTNADIDSNPNFIYVQVHNRGCKNFSGGNYLHLYTSVVSGGTSWETQNWGNGTISSFGYEITYDSVGMASAPAAIPSITSGDSAIVEVQWGVHDLMPGDSLWESCLLARIEGLAADTIHVPDTLSLADWIHYNNNIALKNVYVINLSSPQMGIVYGKPYPGGYFLIGNSLSRADTFDFHLDIDPAKVGAAPTLADEAEIVFAFKEGNWDVSQALDNSTLSGLTQLDTTLFLVSGDHPRIKGFIMPADSTVLAFLGYAFLTQEVTDTMYYLYHFSQFDHSDTNKVIIGQHFPIYRVSRNLFTADAGSDVEIVSGDTTTLTAEDIGEDASYRWYNASGDSLYEGENFDVWPDASATYTLEVIADADGYKDYDDVTLTVTDGQIISIVPNPATTGTVTITYHIENYSSARIEVIEVSTGNPAGSSPYSVTLVMNIHSILMYRASPTVRTALYWKDKVQQVGKRLTVVC